jgi:glutamate formiminotransferase
LAERAVQALMRFETTNTERDTVGEGIDHSGDSDPMEIMNKKSIAGRHPTVGLVDHVSVLPLDENNVGNNNDSTEQNDIASIAGSVARNIGETLESSGADVLYYGQAHPSGKELAAVRRDSTRFFKENTKTTVGAQEHDHHGGHERIPPSAGQATVGAPPRFVENYNIRLEPSVSRAIARTLTESVRERSGRGLPFVEALTLAYGPDQYEVACNLLDPTVTSARDVEERMRDWEREQSNGDGDAALGLVETAYRVGTTTDMCLDALRAGSTENGETVLNKDVFERLKGYF